MLKILIYRVIWMTWICWNCFSFPSRITLGFQFLMFIIMNLCCKFWNLRIFFFGELWSIPPHPGSSITNRGESWLITYSNLCIISQNWNSRKLLMLSWGFINQLSSVIIIKYLKGNLMGKYDSQNGKWFKSPELPWLIQTNIIFLCWTSILEGIFNIR